MKRRSEGKHTDKKRKILRKDISSGFDTVDLWIESTHRQLDIYKEELRQAREEIEKLRSIAPIFMNLLRWGISLWIKRGKSREQT